MEIPDRSNYNESIYASVSVRHQTANFDEIDQRIQPIVSDAINRLFKDDPKGLLLMGAVGCGKTSILSVIYKTYLSEYLKIKGHIDSSSSFPIGSITHGQLINVLRNHASDLDFYKPTWPREISSKVMLIDDLGRGYDDKSGYNVSLQDEYFDYRWKNMFPTFISTNYTKNELRSWSGWERIIDRIGDPNWISPIVVPGESRRKLPVSYNKKEQSNDLA